MLKSKKFFISILIIFLFCAIFYFFKRKYIIENARNKKNQKNKKNKKSFNAIANINAKNKDKYPGIKLLKGNNFNDLYRKLVDKYKDKKKNNMLVEKLKIRNKSISFGKNVKVVTAIRYFNDNIADLGITQYT
jgi:hypothetical protein